MIFSLPSPLPSSLPFSPFLFHFQPCIFLFFLLLFYSFPGSILLSVKTKRRKSREKQLRGAKASTRRSPPQVHQVHFFKGILNHKGHLWKTYSEGSKGRGIYFTKELNIIVMDGSSRIKRNYVLGIFEIRQRLKCKPQNEDNLQG